jgi:hypothetical protein
MQILGHSKNTASECFNQFLKKSIVDPTNSSQSDNPPSKISISSKIHLNTKCK